MVAPAMNVGSNPLKVDVGVAVLRHAKQNVDELLARVGHGFEILRELRYVFSLRGIQCGADVSQQPRGFELDVDVHQDEPVLVGATQEVLKEL